MSWAADSSAWTNVCGSYAAGTDGSAVCIRKVDALNTGDHSTSSERVKCETFRRWRRHGLSGSGSFLVPPNCFRETPPISLSEKAASVNIYNTWNLIFPNKRRTNFGGRSSPDRELLTHVMATLELPRVFNILQIAIHICEALVKDWYENIFLIQTSLSSLHTQI